MATVNFYPGGGRAALGGKTNRIPYITTKPGQLNTAYSARLNFGADMIEALMDKREADKEKGIRSDMLAAMLGDKYQYDPNKASESFTPSEYIESQRVALADAQAQAQPEGVSAFGSDSTALAPSLQSMPFTDFEPENIEALMAQAPSSGISSEALVPKFESTDFTPQRNLGDAGAMQAALIGDIETPLGYAGDRGGLPASTEAEELAAYAGSPEEMAAQESAYKATVNTPDAVAARMAELVASNPEVANHPAYQEWAMSHLAEQQKLRAESTARDQAVDLRDEQRLYDEGISDIENQRKIAAALAEQQGKETIEGLKPSSGIKPTKPVTFDMRDPEATRLELGLAEGSEGTYRYKQDPTSGEYALERIGSAVEDNNEGSQSTILSLYKEQTKLEEQLVDMDSAGVLATDPEHLRIENRLDVLKTIIDKDAMKRAAGAYFTEGGKQKEGRDSLDYEQAQKAVTDLERDEKLIRLLHKGNATTGFAAEWIQTINRTVNFFKDDKRLAEGISDTQLVDVLMGAQVFPLIQALGIGARGMDTPNEREFMRKVLTGTLTLDKETLLEMARMRQKQSVGSIKNWDTRLNRGEVDDYLAVNRISKENARIQNPYSDQNRIAAINEMNLDQVIQYNHPGLPEKVKEAILSRIRALK